MLPKKQQNPKQNPKQRKQPNKTLISRNFNNSGTFYFLGMLTFSFIYVTINIALKKKKGSNYDSSHKRIPR